MQQGIADIIKIGSELSTKKEKIAYFQQAAKTCEPLTTVFRLMFDKGIEFDLPEGAPPYEENKKDQNLQNVLYQDFRKFRYFIKDQEQLEPQRREQIFIDFIGALDPDDAKLVISIKDKQSPYEGIDKKLIKEAFKDLAKDW